MEFLNLHDYEAAARDRLDLNAWEYFRGGAGDEITMRKNRAAFERLMVATHQGIVFKDSTRTTVETDVKFLTPDIAVVHARWKISGDKNLDGTTREPRNGVMTRVVAKRDGRWVIVAAHNTNTVPPR